MLRLLRLLVSTSHAQDTQPPLALALLLQAQQVQHQHLHQH
jgi:hypothetical protein